jgi:hypothetical protein
VRAGDGLDDLGLGLGGQIEEGIGILYYYLLLVDDLWFFDLIFLII